MTQQQLRKIAEGREAEIFAWEDGAVLRLLRNPNAQRQVEWEAQAMEAARAAGVRVPAVHGVTVVEGRPGLIMERIDGLDMLTLIGRRPWTVWAVGRISGQIHAELHSAVAPDDLPSLRERLRRHIDGSSLVPERLAQFALAELERLPDGDKLCHGDFHPGNIIQTDGERVLIDWTNVTRDDPAADFARARLLLRLGEPPPGSPLLIRVAALFARRLLLNAYVRSYRRERPIDVELVARWEAPVMANRLVENIESERPKLLRLREERAGAG